LLHRFIQDEEKTEVKKRRGKTSKDEKTKRRGQKDERRGQVLNFAQSNCFKEMHNTRPDT